MHDTTGLAIRAGIVVLCRFLAGAMAPAAFPSQRRCRAVGSVRRQGRRVSEGAGGSPERAFYLLSCPNPQLCAESVTGNLHSHDNLGATSEPCRTNHALHAQHDRPRHSGRDCRAVQVLSGARSPPLPSPIWRWCCQGVGLGVRGVGGCGGDVVAGGGAVRACSDFATVVSLISGGWVPQDLVFVARPLSRVECRRWAAGSWGNRGLWCARVPGGPGRLVSRNGLWVAFRSWRARARAGRGVRA